MKENLLSVICNLSMQHAARLACNAPNLNHAKLAACLKTEVHFEYSELVAELAEANEAFFGNEGMLNLVMNVGCQSIAVKAWKNYQA